LGPYEIEKSEKEQLLYARFLRWNRIRIISQTSFALAFCVQSLMAVQFVQEDYHMSDYYLISINGTALIQNGVLALFAWYAFVPIHNPITICFGVQLYWKSRVDTLNYSNRSSMNTEISQISKSGSTNQVGDERSRVSFSGSVPSEK